jgi:asparagine synthase (glutamine-hydrolysing)
VDNRDDLSRALRGAGMTLREPTDAELVLRAYQHWGEDCPREIIGDFAFVIWNARKKEAFCARDPIGVKPFYYHLDDHVLLCSSDIRPLLEHERVTRTPNEGMIGEYLSILMRNREETLLKDVMRLHPAHALTVAPRAVRMKRYWDIDPFRMLPCRTDAEYAECFFETLSEAVRCRMRSHKMVASTLSGGLDSSAIAVVAHELRKAGRVSDVGFEVFGIVFPGWQCDERGYMDDVARTCGLVCHHVPRAAPDALDHRARATRYADVPDYPNGAMGVNLHAEVAARGARVLLGGSGGDELFTGSQSHYADLLRQGRILALGRQYLQAARVPAYRMSLFQLARVAILPLMPHPVRHAMRSLRAEVRSQWPWLDRDFARRICLVERLDHESNAIAFRDHAQARVYRGVTAGWSVHAFEMEQRWAAERGFEHRYPFLDRRVVELALALPEDQRWRGDRSKFIIREAMGERWPASVRERRTKAFFDHVFPVALRACRAEEMFDSLEIAKRGWVDGPALRALFRQMMSDFDAGNLGFGQHIWPTWLSYGVELWYRHVVNADPLCSVAR